MGMFSWKTSDTKEPIRIVGCRGGALKVYLVTPEGKSIYEPRYRGYGKFGGLDAHALLAKWNAPELCCGDEEKDRLVGIKLQYSGKELKFPLKFSQNPEAKYEDLEPAEEYSACHFRWR